jgi:hypothetical protein
MERFPFSEVRDIELWWHDPRNEDARRCLVTLLNFCDEVAGEYLRGILERRIADKNIACVAVSVWATVAEFVERFTKDTGKTRAWNRLKEFAAKWLLPPAESA